MTFLLCFDKFQLLRTSLRRLGVHAGVKSAAGTQRISFIKTVTFLFATFGVAFRRLDHLDGKMNPSKMLARPQAHIHCRLESISKLKIADFLLFLCDTWAKRNRYCEPEYICIIEIFWANVIPSDTASSIKWDDYNSAIDLARCK